MPLTNTDLKAINKVFRAVAKNEGGSISLKNWLKPETQNALISLAGNKKLKLGAGVEATKPRDSPKRPMTAYLCFCDDERPNVKKDLEGTEFKSTDIMKELSSRWRALKVDKAREDVYNQYVQKSQGARADYKAAMDLVKTPVAPKRKYVRKTGKGPVEDLSKKEDSSSDSGSESGSDYSSSSDEDVPPPAPAKGKAKGKTAAKKR